MRYKVLSLISGELDSPIAAYLLARRGFKVDLLHFDAESYNEGILLYKTTRIFERFKKNNIVKRLYVVHQKYLLDILTKEVPPNLLIVVWRRFMVRIAERIAKRYGYDFLATGDSIGQVASQTIYNMYVIDQTTEMHILKPLLLWNKKDIIKMNHKLGIYDITSITSSCLLGIPLKSKTCTKLSEILKIEEKLNVEELVDKYKENLEILE